MRLSQVPSSRPLALPLGEMRFVASALVPDVCTDLSSRKFLVVGASAGPLAPNGLRRRIDDAVEGELATRGALPAAIGVDAELASCIRDQVFRARALGTSGLAIALPPLSELTDPEGRLNVDDSAALLAWTRATAELPVVILASDADRTVAAYAPMPLEKLLAAEGRAAPAAPPPAVDEATWIEASREPASDPFDMTPAPAAVSSRRSALSPEGPALRDMHDVRAMPENRRVTPPPPAVAEPAPRPAKISLPEDRPEDGAGTQLKSGILKGTKRRAQPAPEPSDHEAHDAHAHGTHRRSAHAHDAQPRASHDDPDLGHAEDHEAPPARPRPEDVVGETATLVARARDAGAARVVSTAEWRNQAIELDAARGPKPVRVIEQLFMTRYVPLLGAVARGEADGAVRNVIDTWSQAFEHSYVDAFSAMRVTNKRPMMTFDAPEIAARIARLNGARGVKLLLVDSMSYDLGERVSAELRARSTANGVCVDRMLLWSALPTTTSMQMALLARGPEALRDVEPPSQPDPEIARGRAIATLRRERVGSREVMKLDLVEARLRNAGAPYEERLDAIADEVATVLARFLESLPPRTLLFVFGDHGFRLPKSENGRGTGPATQGGASPEEVLVPGYAWLSGGVH